MAEVPEGLWNTPLRALKVALKQREMDLYLVRHWWDKNTPPTRTDRILSI